VPLTRSRTRTQTTPTRLAQLVANIHGDLEVVERLARDMVGSGAHLPRASSSWRQTGIPCI
jgi:hypothetical protein